MNGSILAIRICNIGTLSDQNYATIEVRSSSKLLQKRDYIEIMLDLGEGIFELMV